MPCYDERSSSDYVEKNAVAPLRKELDYVSGLLCELLRLHPIHDAPPDLKRKLTAWFNAHRQGESK